MMPVIQRRSSARKKKLFAVACVRRIAAMVVDPMLADAIDAAERFADAMMSAKELDQARGQLETRFLSRRGQTEPEVFAGQAAWALLYVQANQPLRGVGYAVDAVAGLAQDQRLPPTNPPRRAIEEVAQVALIRDIFGNPFQPVAFDPSWRTSIAVGLARTMYDSRDFAAMPILADALEEAGCDNADVLTHCRGPGPHVRGCWVVDLVLGKS